MVTFGLYAFFYVLALVVAEAIHLKYSPRRQHFVLRLSLCVVALAGISITMPYFTEKLALLNILTCFLLFAATVGSAFICIDDTFFHVVNKCVFGWLTLCCSLAWVWMLSEFSVAVREDLAVAIPVSCVVNYIVFFVFSVYNHNRRRRSVKPGIFGAQLVIAESAALVLFAVITAVALDDVVIPVGVFVFVIVYLCFGILNAYSDEKRLNDEYVLLTQLQQKERERFRLSKEYIDAINLKSHDMKHLIYGLRNASAGELDGELARIEEVLDEYGVTAHTGNAALDVVLTEKGRYCVKRGISLASSADGALISFMEPTDIYSMIGNLLDNAIEAAEKLDDVEKKTISLFVRKECGVVHIRTENYYKDAVSFVNGLPVTGKNDRVNHGFGTKSIRLTATKYQGYVNFTAADGVFVADVLLLLPQ